MAVLALFYNFRSLHRPGRGKESIYECAECGHAYTFARHRPMNRCPAAATAKTPSGRREYNLVLWPTSRSE